MSLRLTNSEAKSWRRCRRQWHLNYFRGLQPRGTDFNKPLSIGSRVHEVLAAYYQPGSVRIVPMDFFRQGVEADAAAYPDKAQYIAKEAELCEAMLTGYFEWLEESGLDSELTVIEPEAELEAELRTPATEGVTILSKIDARVERKSDKARLALEHKTVADLKKPVRKLQVDTQLLHEHLVEFLAALEEDPSKVEDNKAQGVLYNMLRKVKRTASAKPPFFGREEVRHNVEELRNHFRHTAAVAREIAWAREQLDAGVDPHDVCYPNPTTDCEWDCDFKDVCLPGTLDDGTDAEPLLDDMFEVGDPLERYRSSVGLTPRAQAPSPVPSDE